MTYFLLNSWTIAMAVSLEEPLTALRLWKNFLWLSLSFFSGASVSVPLCINKQGDQPKCPCRNCATSGYL